jgi:hypothetical protein
MSAAGPLSPKPIMAVLSNVTEIATILGIGRFPSNPDRDGLLIQQSG